MDVTEVTLNFKKLLKLLLIFLLFYSCTDGADVLYNKFNVTSSIPPENLPLHPNSNYSCVVTAADYWTVSQCTDEHHVVCQSG